MELEQAIKGMIDAEANLRSKTAIDDPILISREMYRLAQYTTAVENTLAEYEEQYETDEGQLLRDLLVRDKYSATAADKHVKMELGPTEGKIKYLTRMTAAAWRLHGDLQSRIKHITDQMKGSV